MRDTCHRNRAQMNSRKYQRRSRNWNSGRLTQPSHQPASDGCHVPSDRRAVPARHVERDLRPPDESHARRRRRTRSAAPPPQIELRRRIAEAMAASNCARAASGIRPRSRNCRTTGRMRLVHDQFRHDQQRQREQQAHVQLHVVEERQRDAGRPTRVPPRPTAPAAAPRPASSAR